MKQYIITIILALCLAACKQYSKHWDTLNTIENQMNENPSEAWESLKNLDKSSYSDEELARYALLSTIAEHRSTSSLSSDSLISIALEYYGDKQTIESARAHFYMGCYYYNNQQGSNNEYLKVALKYFQEAKDLTPYDEKRLLGIHSYYLGVCYYNLGMLDNSIKELKEYLELCTEKEDEVFRAEANRIINFILLSPDISKDVIANSFRVNTITSKNTNHIIWIIIITSNILIAALIYYYRKRKCHLGSHRDMIYSDDTNQTAVLMNKLSVGKNVFETTDVYRSLIELWDLTEYELKDKKPFNSDILEETIFSSFYEAYPIIASIGNKMSRKEIVLCLLTYMQVPTNVIAYCSNTIPGTVRKRKARIADKLPTEIYQLIFG